MNSEDYKKMIVELVGEIENREALIKIFTTVEFWHGEERGRA